MKHTVVWSRGADAALLSMYLDAIDKNELSDACNRIERALKMQPEYCGQPHRSLFVYVVDPLRVYFELSVNDRMVRIVVVERLDH
jgi:hypothetical protein